MNEELLKRVKNSLNKQYYTMNNSWLADCVEFYLNDHDNATQEEITAFVMNQWTLYDLREINNENGCLPRNLASQKFTTLPSKYILQVDKMYDISTSKYKQLEKIRNVSSENIEATENENKTQEDKFQTWEPKSKRMLQLFLTDGVQDILAIEYKTIRFLKEFQEPGHKVMIKGPVICRKGVLLLEENNIVEIGGEVDSLLVTNALENVLARALNLEENPDPYNDKNRPKQNTESAGKTAQVDDDFDLDSQALDQIDKQIQQQSTNVSAKNSATSNLSSKLSYTSKMSELNYSYQAPSIPNPTPKSSTSSARNQQLNSGSTLNNQKNKTQKDYNVGKNVVDFDDEGDSFLEMVDDSEFKTPSVSKVSTVQGKSATSKTTPLIKSKDDEFPDDDEIYDLTDSNSPFFPLSKSKPQTTTTKVNSQKTIPSGIVTSSPKNIYSQKHLNREKETSKTSRNENPSISSSYKTTSKVVSQSKNYGVATPSVSDIDNLDDIDMDFNDDFEDYFDKGSKNNVKSSKPTQASASSPTKVTSKNSSLNNSPYKFDSNNTVSSDATYYENEFEEDFYARCKKRFIEAKTSSQSSVKSTSKSKTEEPAIASTSSHVTKTSSTKLSDKLRLENKNMDYYTTHNKAEGTSSKMNQMSTGSTFKSKNVDEHSASQTNKSSSTKNKFESQRSYENLDAAFENDFDIEFEARMEVDSKQTVPKVERNTMKVDTEKNVGYSRTKSQDPVDNDTDSKLTGSKRPASIMSPSMSSRPKVRCLESTPKDKTNSKKITDFFNQPEPMYLNEKLALYEFICDILERRETTTDSFPAIVRGKVVNVVKLELVKEENKSIFKLDGTITDTTANLDIVFSSKVLEVIIGFSPQEFILKRKRSKTDPKIKDELREDLKNAQQHLTVMDAMMEIVVEKNKRACITSVMPLKPLEKKNIEERTKRYKIEKGMTKRS